MITKNDFTTLKKSILGNRLTPIILSGIVAGIFCIILFGYKIMIPTNTAWLYANGDISQHQIGWDFFRHDAWRMPLGSMKNLAAPEGSSLVYMDSIPLVAIIFKVVAPILPEHFQYFGLWGLVCFILQGALGAVIVRKYSKSPLLITLGAMFFVLAPVLLFRAYAHTALASQWIILAAFCLFLYRERIQKTVMSVSLWTALFVIAVGIHPYFVPMVGFILLAYLLVRRSGWIDAVIHIGAAGIGFLACFWLVGGFVTKDVGTATLGMYGADLNALINPINYSYFLRPLPTSAGAYEGIAYLGLGTYLLLTIAISLWLLKAKKTSKMALLPLSRVWVGRNKNKLYVGGIILVTIALAVGPVVYFNGNHLLTLNMPDSVARAISIFRSTGRFMWIAVYAITAFSVGVMLVLGIKQGKSRNGLLVLLTLLLAVQLVDVVRSEGLRAKAATIRHSESRENRFTRTEVLTLLNGKTRIAYVENNLHVDNFFELGQVAAEKKMTINDGYISRKPTASVARQTAQAHEELTKDNLRDDTVYVTNNENDIKAAINNTAVSIVRVDSTWLVATR